MTRLPRKLIVRLFFCSVLLLLCISSVGYAECNLPAKQKLTNEQLLKAIKKTEYAAWKLYGPADSEIVGKNVYATAFFKNAVTFPVVAVKDDQAALLIMRRDGKSWSLLSANEQALTREDFVLSGFSVDTSSYDSEAPSVLASFDFSSQSHPNDSGYRYSLGMWINGKDEFVNLYVFAKEHELEQFSDYYAVIVNEEALIYRCHTPDGFERVDYLVAPNPVDHSLSSFSLADLPILPSDLMTEAKIHSADDLPINLYIQPDIESDAMTTVPDHSVVQIMQERVTFNDMQWYFVRYKNSLGYIPCSHIEMEQ